MKAFLSVLLFLPILLFSQEGEQVEKSLSIEKPDTLEQVINDIPEIAAAFPGGSEEMRQFTIENLKYPELAELLGNHGKVFVEFIVTKEGENKDIEVVRGVSVELDEEAVRFVKSMPNWTPAVLNGEKIDTTCRVPVIFKFSKH